ncbi:MAG: hypothetical protein ACMG6E_01605 [Candidatus Roizmanbacteria bacterium]
MPPHRGRRQQVNNNQLIGYFVLLVLLIIFLGTVGLKFLLNTSIFVADKLSKNRTSISKEEDTDFSLPPEFDFVPEATNAAELQLTGSAPKDKSLKIYINNSMDKDILLTEDTFDVSITLNQGQNTLYAESVDPKTQIVKKSREYTVFYSNKKPTLEISSPSDGSITDKQDIDVNGTTDADVTITVNGKPAVTTPSGSFSFSLHLHEGDNAIVVKAVDLAGNSEEKTITVKKES